MGIAFVLILYFAVLGIAAVICSVILGAGLGLYLKHVTLPKRKVIAFGSTLPFLCVAYAAVWFVTYFVVSDTVFHHDPMIGDGWYTDIGSGYAIDMIDVTDQGIVHPTTGESHGLNNPAGIDGVRRLQVAPPYLFGTQDSHYFEHLGKESNEEDAFFAVDTRERKKTTFSSESALSAYATANGQKLNLAPILTVYQQHRSKFFDLFAVGVLLFLPLVALLATLHAAYRLKHPLHDRLAQQLDSGTST